MLEPGRRVELKLEGPAETGQKDRVELVVVGQVVRSGAGRTAIAIKYEFARQMDKSLAAGAASA
jgi:hypothetical protein